MVYRRYTDKAEEYCKRDDGTRACSIMTWKNGQKKCGDCGHDLPSDFHFGKSYNKMVE